MNFKAGDVVRWRTGYGKTIVATISSRAKNGFAVLRLKEEDTYGSLYRVVRPENLELVEELVNGRPRDAYDDLAELVK